MPHQSSLRLASAAALAMGVSSSLFAQTAINWDGATTAFATGSNWVGGAVPTSDTTTHVATFGDLVSGSTKTVNLAGARSINGLNFTASGYSLTGTNAYTIGSGGIDASGSLGTISMANNVTLSGGQTWNIGSGTTLARSGTLNVGSTSSTLTIDGGGTVVFGGTGSGGGSGAVSVAINSGTLVVNGATGLGATTGNVTVASGGTLAGTGSVNINNNNRKVTVNGTIRVGDPTASLAASTFSITRTGTGTANEVVFNNGSALLLDLFNTTTGDKFSTNSAGLGLTLNSGSSLTVADPNAISFAAGLSWDLLDFSSISGTFSSVNLPTLSGGLAWDTSTLYSTGVISITAIPEPSSFAALAGAVLLGYASLRRNRRR